MWNGGILCDLTHSSSLCVLLITSCQKSKLSLTCKELHYLVLHVDKQLSICRSNHTYMTYKKLLSQYHLLV